MSNNSIGAEQAQTARIFFSAARAVVSIPAILYVFLEIADPQNPVKILSLGLYAEVDGAYDFLSKANGWFYVFVISMICLFTAVSLEIVRTIEVPRHSVERFRIILWSITTISLLMMLFDLFEIDSRSLEGLVVNGYVLNEDEPWVNGIVNSRNIMAISLVGAAIQVNSLIWLEFAAWLKLPKIFPPN